MVYTDSNEVLIKKADEVATRDHAEEDPRCPEVITSTIKLMQDLSQMEPSHLFDRRLFNFRNRSIHFPTVDWRDEINQKAAYLVLCRVDSEKGVKQPQFLDAKEFHKKIKVIKKHIAQQKFVNDLDKKAPGFTRYATEHPLIAYIALHATGPEIIIRAFSHVETIKDSARTILEYLSEEWSLSHDQLIDYALQGYNPIESNDYALYNLAKNFTLEYSGDLIGKKYEKLESKHGKVFQMCAPDIILVKGNNIEGSKKYGPKYLHANKLSLKTPGGSSIIQSQAPLKGEQSGFYTALLRENIGLIVNLTNRKDMIEKGVGSYVDPYRNRSSFMVGAEGYTLKQAIHSSPRWGVGEDVQEGELTFHSPMLLNPTTFTQIVNAWKPENKVQYLHFKQWPDHGVIPANQLIQLAEHIEQLSSQTELKGRPIWIHCRAGVGRSGVVSSYLDVSRRIGVLISQGEKITAELINRLVLGVVLTGRRERGPCFVQTPEQMNLLVLALRNKFIDI